MQSWCLSIRVITESMASLVRILPYKLATSTVNKIASSRFYYKIAFTYPQKSGHYFLTVHTIMANSTSSSKAPLPSPEHFNVFPALIEQEKGHNYLPTNALRSPRDQGSKGFGASGNRADTCLSVLVLLPVKTCFTYVYIFFFHKRK